MFIRNAFIDNKWLWFHMLGGGIIARILLGLTTPVTALIVVLLIAIAWEVLEFVTRNVEDIYGSKSRFFMDAAGDISGAAVMAALVIF